MSKKELTPWQSFFDKEYLGSHNFDDGEEKTVTISEAGQREVTLPGGKKEKCLVVSFREGIKPMVCNVTNSKAIQKIAGTRYIENWAGNEVTLYVDKTVKFRGETVEGIRVKPVAAASKKETLTMKHKAWNDCVKALQDGYKIENIRGKYNVSAEVEEQLEEALQQPA